MTTSAAPPGPRRLRLRFWLGTALVGLLAALYPASRAFKYAADPTGPKDCGPHVPVDGGAKPTRINIAPAADIPWSQRGGTVNDASCLNRTAIYGLVEVREVEDVRRALGFARANQLKISIAGVKHSMGGQAFAPNAVVLDMTRFNRMSLDANTAVLNVQSGATWHDIQKFLHPRFAVKAMQSTDIFTVGGSIAVNAHGMDHRAGSVGRTIRSMRVMLADGSIRDVGPKKDARLFQFIVGGYGLFGVVLDVDLEVTPNTVYRSERRLLDYREFPAALERDVLPDGSVGLLYGHLSTSPTSFLKEMLLYSYREAGHEGEMPPLDEVSSVKFRRLIFNFSKQGALPMRLKWWAEKNLEPRFESCPVARSQAMAEGEACLVTRNHPMHDSVHYLRNSLPGDTDILQEFFLPRHRFVAFVDRLRATLRRNEANLLNASVRVVHREENVLTYAPEDNMVAIVLYLNQSTDGEGNAHMARLTRELIEECLAEGGRFFLPYQLHYTREQLARSYPEADAFFAAKRQLDTQGLFTNTWYEKYGLR